MSYPFSLKEVSKMFGIPITTLRYWENHDLIQLQRNDNNNYKEFFFDDLAYVCDVDLYHSLGFNRNELKNLYSMNTDRFDELLALSDKRIEEEIIRLRTTQTMIQKRRELFSKIEKLRNEGYTESDINIEKIVSISEDEDELIRYGKQFLTTFSIVMDMENAGETLQYGFTVPADFSHGTPIFEKGSSDRKYIKFLMELPLESLAFPYEYDPFAPYIKPHIEKISKLYAPPKKLVLRFILVANNTSTGKPCYYEEVFAEI